MLVEFALPLAVGPVVVAITVEGGSALELLFSDVGSVPAQARVVRQLAPRNGVFVRSHSQEPAERHDGVRDLPTELFDHQALDAADAFSLRVVNRRTLDPITLNKGLAGH